MTISGFGRCAITNCAAVAILTGCGGSQPPIAASREPSSAAVGKDQSLLYVSDRQAGDVYMIALPSGRLVGKLTGFDSATDDCIDRHGNVFVDDSLEGQIRAYAHGAKSAFRVLSDPSWEPLGCSVDPKTGNLAVSNFSRGQSEGTLVVYFNAKGAAHYRSYPGVEDFWYCAYDGDGNLFTDATGYDSNSIRAPIVLELPKGGRKLRPVSLSPALTGGLGPPLFWDGKHLAIASSNSGAIYQYQISGGTGTRVGVVKLDDASIVSGPFWIASNGNAQTLYAPTVEDSIESVGVYRYPSGGKRLQNLYDAPIPFAVAISMPK